MYLGVHKRKGWISLFWGIFNTCRKTFFINVIVYELLVIFSLYKCLWVMTALQFLSEQWNIMEACCHLWAMVLFHGDQGFLSVCEMVLPVLTLHWHGFKCQVLSRMGGFKCTVPLNVFMTVQCIEDGSMRRINFLFYVTTILTVHIGKHS
jgi:hypothetical protein